MGRLGGPLRVAVAAVREALSNDGIRRLELAWLAGIAADAALLVVLLVVVFERDGALGTGILGAVRMVPAVAAGMLSGALLEKVRGRPLLVAIGVTRVVGAVLAAVVIATDGPTPALFALAGLVAAAGAPVRPIQATLMPAIARSPGELVASNMAWSTGEGLGAFSGPFLAGVLVAVGAETAAAGLAAVGFAATIVAVAGLRFEHAADATGGAGHAAGGLRLGDGLRALRRRPVPRWTMVTVFGQVMTRGLLNTLVVVAAIELLDMGEGGVGLLNAALGIGGLFGAIFAVSLTRTNMLVRTACASLAWWGAPIAVIGLVPFPAVALTAMVITGVANAVYDIAIFTIFQRGSTNEERAPVFSVFEGVVGLGSVTGSLLAPVLIVMFGNQGALAIAGAFLPILALVVYGAIGRNEAIAVVDEPTVRLLRQVPIFAALPLTAVERVAAGLRRIDVEPGAMLMRQGDEGDEFLVIDAGEVDVSVDGRPIHRLGHGAGVGEIALVRRSPRTATVVAVGPVTAWSVDCRTFLAAVSGPAAAAVTEHIAETHLARSAAATPAPSS
ncbi:MAG: cyclic nucleotide-binding domain-containing protein [Chloroflexota bacterium]